MAGIPVPLSGRGVLEQQSPSSNNRCGALAAAGYQSVAGGRDVGDRGVLLMIVV
jgi:hypothetical protein